MNVPAYSIEHKSSNRSLAVRVVSSNDDLNKVRAIRSAVFLGEQSCPYDEEFGGNDYCGAHLLGLVDDEPAGCLRTRFFSTFLKLEHFAVRQEFRKSRIAFLIARASIEFARKKGYTTLYAHTNQTAERFWRMFGFRPVVPQREITFSGFRYTEMRLDVQPDPEAITLDSDPYVIDRPEGRWHHTGVLEASRGTLQERIGQRASTHRQCTAPEELQAV